MSNLDSTLSTPGYGCELFIINLGPTCLDLYSISTIDLGGYRMFIIILSLADLGNGSTDEFLTFLATACVSISSWVWDLIMLVAVACSSAEAYSWLHSSLDLLIFEDWMCCVGALLLNHDSSILLYLFNLDSWLFYTPPWLLSLLDILVWTCDCYFGCLT